MSTRIDQEALLGALSQMSAMSEREPLEELRRTYYPVPEHLRAFDPDVVLVIGPRGAGKTELFQAVVKAKLLPSIARWVPNLRLPPLDATSWVPVDPTGRELPDSAGFRKYDLQNHREDDPSWRVEYRDLWGAYLIRHLAEHLDDLARSDLAPVLEPQAADVLNVVQSYRTRRTEATMALDRLDARLTRDDQWLFVAYDELDTMGETLPVMLRLAQSLASFWATYARRWRRIRSKLFLRTDLYERLGPSGPDLAKLSANRAEIVWSDRRLYGMLVRRIANTSEELRAYTEAKVRLQSDPDLGWLPVIDKPLDARPFVERLIGPYMGANVRKGLSYRWILEHVRDGLGFAFPRPLIRLMSHAAELQQRTGTWPRSPRLLDPPMLRRALDRISEEHVQSVSDVWPWIEPLGRALAGQRVPWERRDLERIIGGAWEALSPASSSWDRPRDFVDYLLEVGVLRARPSGGIDVPDLYLAGLGLRRRGGVARR